MEVSKSTVDRIISSVDNTSEGTNRISVEREKHIKSLLSAQNKSNEQSLNSGSASPPQIPTDSVLLCQSAAEVT